jgi:Helicase conserved C-terminal domain
VIDNTSLISDQQGCNIHDIEVVIQWKTPRDLSSWVQRAGRAARGPGRQGLAVMIVEKSAFEVVEEGLNSSDQQSSVVALGQGRGGRGRGGFRGGRRRGGGLKGGVAYGVLHGSKRGQHGGAHDIPSPQEEKVPEPLGAVENAEKEGLYLYIQTSDCRRILLGKVFKNSRSG